MIRAAFRRHRAMSITALALTVVLLAATAAELAARALLQDRLATAAGRALGRNSTVDIDGGPALLALLDRHLDAVTIGNDHATLGRIPDVSVRARLQDVRLTGERAGTVAAIHAAVEVPATSLEDLTGTKGSRLPVTDVHLDEKADTITLGLGQAGLGQATLQPRLQDGHVTLHLENAEILGRPAPLRLVDRIQNTLTTRTAADYPLGLKATSLDVTPTGLSIGLDAGRTRLPARTKT
ncbi:LmeA family phospholipid-binding protein [Streptomyces sp. NPDC085900]|uniref:LmeA family phospholipid-binding protein n=1 Tax=Streptomyces sp. NPDC085900 TaxID=3365737 RepID=UPI0037D4A97F